MTTPAKKAGVEAVSVAANVNVNPMMRIAVPRIIKLVDERARIASTVIAPLAANRNTTTPPRTSEDDDDM